MLKPAKSELTIGSVGPEYREIIYKLMMLNLHKNVLEIGCLNGYSTTAFINSINDGANFKFTVCDIKINSSVRLLANCCVKPITVCERRSEDVINGSYDFIFVDGSHTLEDVGGELLRFDRFKTKSILAHDTFLYPGPSREYWGAVLLNRFFSNHRDYYASHDYKKNHKWRRMGLSFFTRDKEVFEKTRTIFKTN